MISRYFIIFPIGFLGESNVYQNMVDFTSTRYFLGGCLTVKNYWVEVNQTT